MAPGSCSRRNAPPRSRLGTAIQMLLGTPPNKGLPHRAMQVFQSPPRLSPSIQRKTCRDSQTSVWIRSSRLRAVDRKAPEKCEDHFDAAGTIVSNRTLFAASFFSVGTSTSVGRTRHPKLPCLGLSSRLSFERVWVTQRLPCISPGVALDKTPSTSKWKLTIGRLTSSISIIKFDADGALEESDLIRFF